MKNTEHCIKRFKMMLYLDLCLNFFHERFLRNQASKLITPTNDMILGQS